MSDATKSSVCIICEEGPTSNKRLVNNVAMVDQLIACCNERLSLGDTELQPLNDRLAGLSESARKSVCYHSECRKPIVNSTLIERLRCKRARMISPDCPPAGPGRPSTSTESARPKRMKTLPKAKVCIFFTCSFCLKNDEDLHLALSDNIGDTLLEIKLKTQDDHVRTCVSQLEESGDASALEKYYHRTCLRSAQRTFTPAVHSNVHLIRSVCDEQLLLSLQNSLCDDDVKLDMAQVNSAYVAILTRYQVHVNETQNYRKHLKKLITERLPHIQFVKSLRKNEPENLVLQSAVSKALDLRFAQLDNSGTVGQLMNIAHILREEVMQHRNWSFNGTFDDFENPPLLQFFLSHLLFGRHILKVSGRRNDEVDKAVDVACQFLVQNMRTDRQVKHQPKKNDGFEQTVQTPLSLGLPLTIHSRVRDKSLVNNLSQVYIGSDYQKILDLEKRVEQGILQRMKETGGFCLPDFVTKGVNIWFAVDNIDLLEDTPNGQNTFHGTVIVINQRAEDGEPVNQPLAIPQKLQTPAPLSFEVKNLQEPVIKTKPIRFQIYPLNKRSHLLTTNFTHTWALANYLGTKTKGDEKQTENRAQPVDDQAPGQNMHLPNDSTEDESETQDQEEAIHQDPHQQNIVQVKERIRKGDKLSKEEVMPSWAGTKSLLLSQHRQNNRKTNSEVVAPLFKTSPTDYSTLYTVLMLTQGISAFVVGPERKTLITLDLDLYNRALQIQQSVGNTNWILRAGVLHISFAALHALGKTVDGSGIDTCAIETGIYTSAALRGIYGGKAYKRGVEYHITTSLAIMMMMFDSYFSEHQSGPLSDQCVALKKALHERNPDMVEIFEDIQAWYSENLKPHEERGDIGDLAEFLIQYLKQVDSLLHLISACRSGDWEGYLAALENIIKYFFARDLLNYSRLMPVHLAQMNALEKDDPSTWEALKSGDFVVAKSEVPFTHLFTDQTLEQEIKNLKRHGGMVGLTQDEAALDRLVTITPHLARIVKEYLNSFPLCLKAADRNEHYQLSGNIAVRSRANAAKMHQSMVLHCAGNPFLTKSPLKSLVSSAIVPDDAKDDILHFAEKGQKQFEEFIHNRLLPTSTISVWDPMKKLKLKTFSNLMAKTKVRLGDKVIKLREERELLGRFLIIQGSRPELVPKLEDTIGEYEMSIVPRALCAVDGSLYIPTDKSSLMHAIEEAKLQPAEPALVPRRPPENRPSRTLIIDAMAVLQSMKKTPAIKKLSDLQDAFIQRIQFMLTGYNEGHVVFDRYLTQSLKNKTRQKRATTSTEYQIHPEMKLTMPLKEILSASTTKSKLTGMFAQALLERFSGNITFKLVVVYDTKIKGHGLEEDHSHEEADTLIPHQVLASAAGNHSKEVCVWSPDTDVLILLLDLVSCGRLEEQISLKFLTGKGSKYREIDVVERVRVIGRQKCQGLIGFHNFSGADWGGKFVGLTKKTWVSAYMKLGENDPVIGNFKMLGEGSVPNQLDNGELPPEVKGLEEFVCHVYCSAGPTTLPALRWKLFRSKNLEGEMLPPTRAALLPHINRANYMAMRDKSYVTNCPVLPAIEQNGWTVEKELFVAVRCLSPPAPRAVIELTKCGCKSGCKGKCSCFKNGLPCTPLCKCYGSDCANEIQTDEQQEDDGDD